MSSHGDCFFCPPYCIIFQIVFCLRLWAIFHDCVLLSREIVLPLPLKFRNHSGGVRKDFINPKSVIRLFCATETSFCHLFRHFSVTMAPHCALKVAKHLFKNKSYYHHNANDRFGIIRLLSSVFVRRENTIVTPLSSVSVRREYGIVSSLLSVRVKSIILSAPYFSHRTDFICLIRRRWFHE